MCILCSRALLASVVLQATGLARVGAHSASSTRAQAVTAQSLVVDVVEASEVFFDVSDRQSLERPPDKKHPFWVFEGSHLETVDVPICVASLLLAGVLCSAGGIGGGGIYVTVLMMAGGLGVEDAVPLSKAVVLLGSLSSLVLNARKSIVAQGRTQALIDYNICRLVVPWSLIGTYLGVLLNRWLPSWFILATLTLILVAVTAVMVQTTVDQYLEERRSPDARQAVAAASARSEDQLAGAPARGGISKASGSLDAADASAAFGMLLVVVACSVLRYHAGQCRYAAAHDRFAACRHPAVFWLLGSLEALARDEGLAQAAVALAFVLPLGVCIAVALRWASATRAAERWRPSDKAAFSCMAAATGCLAGLVGIGGGLIFSPFFLTMGVEPAVAVATSSTCVIFTSTSTTLQYLLTDRIIVSLALVYGLANLIASYAGTTFVHYLQDAYGARRSMISATVAVGVLLSTVMSSWRLVEGMREGLQVDVH